MSDHVFVWATVHPATRRIASREGPMSNFGWKFPRVPSLAMLAGGLAGARYRAVGVDSLDDDDALGEDEKREAAVALGGFRGEARTQLNLALPVSLSMICNRVMSLTSVAFVGHLGSLPLAGAALATTLGNVTGNSVLVGMASAISTIGGQAYGAGAYATLGHVTQRALLILTLATLPIAALWSSAEPALLAMGQDPDIARAAAAYLARLIPGLFFYAWNITAQAYMQSQRITRPGAVAGVVAALLHVPANVVFIRVLGLGYAGAALATSWSNGVVLCINVGYLAFVKRDLPGKATWDGWSLRAATSGWRQFLGLAIPGILMMAEWWASEVNILLAGWLPDPELNVAAVSIFQVTNALAFMIPVGFSVAVLTRCSNELGANAPARARHAVAVAFAMIVTVEAAVSVAVLAARRDWGRLYTDDDRVVHLVERLLVPLSVYTAFDGVLCVASGVIKACGKQWVAGPVVAFAYYVVGIPAACWLAFRAGAGAMGLAVGATVGTMVHSIIIVGVVARTDWRAEARRAAERAAAAAAAVGGGGDEESKLGDGNGDGCGGGSGESLLPMTPIAEVELQDRRADGKDDASAASSPRPRRA